MPNLDNLISKIVSDCETKSKEIIATAEKKAAETINESTAAAEEEKKKLLAGADIEAERAAELILAGKKLEIRDDHLNAKRQVMDKVFERALVKLNDMPKDEFLGFIGKSLAGAELDGSSIVLPKKYALDIKELNALLAKKGASGSLKAADDSRSINGGFILVKEGVESNNTFETLIGYYRDELEGDIIAKLF